jgi:hypothetical protein
MGMGPRADRHQRCPQAGILAFNTMGDNQARLEDIGQGRVEAMDAAGIDDLISYQNDGKRMGGNP